MKFTQHHKNALIKQCEAALSWAKEMPVSQGCESCLYADMGGVGPLQCRLANHMVVPPDVVEVGCEKYTFNPNDVPF